MPNSKWDVIKRDIRPSGISEVYFWKSNWEWFDPHDPLTPISFRYLLYRFLYMAFFISGLMSGACASFFFGPYYVIYLTIQSFLAQLVYSVIAFFYVLWVFIKKRRSNEMNSNANAIAVAVTNCCEGRLPLACKIIWMMLSVVQVLPAIVSLGFWFIVVPSHGMTEIPDVGACEHIHNLVMHLFNFIMAITDALVVAVPTRIAHCIFVVGFALYYAFFTVCYEMWNGTYPKNREYIYSVMNWRRKPLLAIITTFISIFVCIFFFIIFSYGMYRLRLQLRKKHVLRIIVDESRQSSISPDVSGITVDSIVTSNENMRDDVGRTLLPRIAEVEDKKIKS